MLISKITSARRCHRGSESKRGTSLSLPNAFRGSSAEFGQLPKVRHGSRAGGHSLCPAPTRDQQPSAPYDHGSADGGRNGGGNDDDALIASHSSCPPCSGAHGKT